MHSIQLGRAVSLGSLTLLLLLGACSDDDDDDGRSTPVEFLVEFEPNDTVATANDFGVLAPGDRLVIEGHISDAPFDPLDPFNGFDPFDSFEFVSATPIEVEFRLVSYNWSDLDLCVFDLQTSQIELCFETAAQPEVGSIEMLDAGVAFQLVVESFQGTGGYDLVLDVFPLFVSTAPPPPTLAEGEEPVSRILGGERATLPEPGRGRIYIEGHNELFDSVPLEGEGDGERVPRGTGAAADDGGR
ncbi:MAG: hypothetical protein WD226_00410 [Planctomycetota bacterium]